MADPDGELTVAQRLGRALDSGLFPAGGPAEAAERLIERLERPARVALLGLPGSGKSSILNLLVGAVVVPETLRLPTIIVQHGSEARMICTLTDGTARIVPGMNLAEVLPLAPALVTMEADLPALKVISLLEVSAGPMEAEQRRAASWAAKRADIVVWCTTSYLPKEQAVWESLPDSVKDNSFMFLTKVDLLGSRDSATAMHERVELRAGEEFRQILSISARQARAAMPQGGPVNRDLFRDSGALAVIGAIKTRVQSGRRADMDTAELLLARHVEASELVARRFAEPGEDVARPPVWTPPPEPAVPEAERDEGAPAPVEMPEVPEAAPDRPEMTGGTGEPGLDRAGSLIEDEDRGQVSDEPAETAETDKGALLEADEAQPEPQPEPVEPEEASSEPTPDGQGSGRRKRFADRIKRVATDTDAAAAPLVPLKSTWKSKAELEAPPEPEPEPEPVRSSERVRRPRASAPAAPDGGDPANAAPEADAAEQPGDAIPQARPAASATGTQTPRTARPQLFGARRNPAGDGETERPLPDLSALRAWPDPEMAEEEALSEEPEAEEPAEEVEAIGSAPETEGETGSVEPDEDQRLTALAARTEEALPVERPRLFDRQPRVRAADAAPPSRAEIKPVGAPLSRSPAPPRMPAPEAVVPEAPAARRLVADEAQFSPRAIMARERPSAPDAPAPRRERPRIAARAVAVAAQAAAIEVSPVDTALLDEAIVLILTRAAGLQAEIDPEAKVPVDLILDHARETTEQVMQIVARGRSEELRRINGDLGEVLDLIMLMQLEKGHAPADDALTLILQLRRELETLRAA